MHVLQIIGSLGALIPLALATKGNTKPPAGAVVVRAAHSRSGEFSTIGDAVNSLPADETPQTVFIYPGTYAQQVNISRPGPVTVRPTHFEGVVVDEGAVADGIHDDLTGTLRVLSEGVALYNLDIVNTFGVAETNGQAIALSGQAGRMGVYACRLLSYQDTLYTNVGDHVFLRSYIEGAVDFIFGRRSIAYFEGNTIATKGAGYVTAHGRELNDTGIYIFNKNKLVAAHDAFANVTERVFLGRPWGNWARVIFKDTKIEAPLNKTIWSIWNPGDERTDFILFAEFDSFGPGVAGSRPAPFSTQLSPQKAEGYTLDTAIPNWEEWVDGRYLTQG